MVGERPVAEEDGIPAHSVQEAAIVRHDYDGPAFEGLQVGLRGQHRGQMLGCCPSG